MARAAATSQTACAGDRGQIDWPVALEPSNGASPRSPAHRLGGGLAVLVADQSKTGRRRRRAFAFQ